MPTAQFRLDSATRMVTIPKESIDCVITSPPYNAGLNYGQYSDDAKPVKEYQKMCRQVTEQLARVTKPGAS